MLKKVSQIDTLTKEIVHLWSRKEAKKEVLSLKDICLNLLCLNNKWKKSNIPAELKDQMRFITWHFSFKLPYAFPPTMMLGRLGCIHYVISVIEKTINAGGRPFLKEKATAELQVMNYKPQPDVTLGQFTGERTKGVKKSGTQTSVSVTVSCPSNWVIAAGEKITFLLHINNPLPLKKQIKKILVTVIQQHKTAEGDNMKWTLQKFRYSLVREEENINHRTVNVSFVTDFSSSFIPTYIRKRGWYAICHFLKVTVAVHGGSDIVTVIPISLCDKKPPLETEELLTKDRPNWPNERAISPLYQQCFETPVSFNSTGGRL